MEKDLINLVKSEMPNDYCKMICAMMKKEDSEWVKEFLLTRLLVYSVAYDSHSLVEAIYEELMKSNVLGIRDRIKILYLYYLEKCGKKDENLKHEVLTSYSELDLTKEFQSLELIENDRRAIINNYRKHEDFVIETFLGLLHRCEIIMNCIRYKFLTDNFEVEENSKIDRLLNWNIFLIKKYNTVKNKNYIKKYDDELV